MSEDRNGWRLVGKIALVVLIPTLGGAVWVGALGKSVEHNAENVATLQTKMDTQSKNQAAILAKLEDIKERLSELRRPWGR